MKELDCLGEICPVPIMKLQGVLEEIRQGERYLLITDHSCTLRAAEEFCEAHGLFLDWEEVMSGVWEIEIASFCLANGGV